MTDMKAVLGHLHEKAGKGRPVSAQVFLSDEVAKEDLPAVVDKIVGGARKRLKLAGDALRVGKIRPLAKSFSVTAEDPDVFSVIADERCVKDMLDAEQSDILPQPVKRKAVL